MTKVAAAWRNEVLVAIAVMVSTLAPPVFAANSEEGDRDAAQSVEILRGDQTEEEEKEKPSPRGTCAWQCERFRKQCEAYCKTRGHLPGMMSPSRTCRQDCKQYREACSRGCRGRAAFR